MFQSEDATRLLRCECLVKRTKGVLEYEGARQLGTTGPTVREGGMCWCCLLSFCSLRRLWASEKVTNEVRANRLQAYEIPLAKNARKSYGLAYVVLEFCSIFDFTSFS